MSLSDSLMPEPSGATQSAEPAVGNALTRDAPEANPFAGHDANVDAEFRHVFGEAGPEVREAVSAAAAAEGPTAYDRFRENPDAFGTVVGNRALASNLGGALEALDYLKTQHAAEQEGRDPVVPGYGPATAQNSTVETHEPAGDGAAGSLAPQREDRREEVSNRGRAPEQTQARTPEQVQHALEVIRDCLASGRGQHVTVGDLRDADRTIWNLTEPGDASQVIRTLDDEGLLDRWAEELDDGYENDLMVLGDYRGLAREERDDFYDRMAARLDGDALARFAGALERNALGTAAEGGHFGEAVAAHAQPEAVADFVRGILPAALSGDAGSPFMSRAAVEGIGGLTGHGMLLERAVEQISSQQGAQRPGENGAGAPSSFERLLEAGVERSTRTDTNVLTVQQTESFDAGPASRMVRAFATANNPALQARVFRDASAVAERLHNDDRPTGQSLDVAPRGQAEAELRRGMSALLLDRTGETVENLMTKGDREGAALTGHIRYLVEQGDTDTISLQLRLLRAERQPGPDDTAESYFSESVLNRQGNPTYPNAARLGYYVGSLTAAFQGIADDDRGAIETLGNIVSELDVPGAGYLASEASGLASSERVESLQRQLDLLQAGVIPGAIQQDVDGNREWSEIDGPEVAAFRTAFRDVTDPPGRLK